MWWISSNPAPTSSTTELTPVQLEDGVAAHVGPAPGTWDMAASHDSTRSTPANAANTAAGTTTSPLPFDPRMKAPTTKLTGAQLFYIIVMQAIPAMIIAGLVNFVVGYRKPPAPPTNPPTTTILM